jgi:predicted ATPase/class 3 adenylate cyclase
MTAVRYLRFRWCWFSHRAPAEGPVVGATGPLLIPSRGTAGRSGSGPDGERIGGRLLVVSSAAATRSGDASPVPTGLVTFVFTDIEGSTELWHDHPNPMRTALERHDALLLAILAEHRGYVFADGGDGFGAAFGSADDAVDAALRVQLAFTTEPWPMQDGLRSRIGIHTGEAQLRAGNYYGLEVNRAARVMAAGHGGQVLVSEPTVDQLETEATPTVRERARGRDEGDRWRMGSIELVHLGKHRLKGIDELTSIWQLVDDRLAPTFPPLKVVDTRHDSLPAFRSAFFGRDEEIATLRSLVTDHRLVTVTGPGGAGKTRVAVEAASGDQPSNRDGVSFADLSALAPSTVVADIWRAIAAATDARSDGAISPRDGVMGQLAGRRSLLVIDNCEHVIDAATEVIDDLTANLPTLTVLATSRETLALGGERVYRLPPLSSRSADAPSIRLFLDRALASDPTFLSEPAELDIVATLCERLEGSPLAIELAASRVPVLRPADILANLDDRLAMLRARRGTGRQTSLRATVEWSYALLDPEQQAALRQLAVLDGSFDAATAEAVAGRRGRSAAIDFLDGLVAKSLVVVEPWSQGLGTRFSLLDTIQAFGLECLSEAGEESMIRDRAATHFHGSLLAEVAIDPFIVASMSRRPRLVADWPGYLAALEWLHGEGAESADASTAVAELASAMAYPWAGSGDGDRLHRWLAVALNEPALAPWLASFAHAMFAWSSASDLQPDTAMRVLNAVQFANETPNDLAALPYIVAAQLLAGIGWNDVALDVSDAAMRSATESRFAGVLVPAAHGARGTALAAARRYGEAVEEFDIAIQPAEGFADDYDFLVWWAVGGAVGNHLLGHHDLAMAEVDSLASRYDRTPDREQMMITMARVVATCPVDARAAGDIVEDHLEQLRGSNHAFDRVALVMLALVDLYSGDPASAATSLALCAGPIATVVDPVVWEYRFRLEGWPVDEFDQRRTAARAAWVQDPTHDGGVSERIEQLLS